MILAIDPGSKLLGWALFTPLLTRLGVARSEGRTVQALIEGHLPQLPEALTGVVELMEVHSRRDGSVGEDLIKITAIGFAVAGRLTRGDVYGYPPTTWKGQVPKGIHHSRIWNALEQEERDVLLDGYWPTRARTKHALDAVGLGLFHLGRLGRGGV